MVCHFCDTETYIGSFINVEEDGETKEVPVCYHCEKIYNLEREIKEIKSLIQGKGLIQPIIKRRRRK